MTAYYAKTETIKLAIQRTQSHRIKLQTSGLATQLSSLAGGKDDRNKESWLQIEDGVLAKLRSVLKAVDGR